MKVLSVLAVIGLVVLVAAQQPPVKYFDHTFYWPWSFGTFYPGGQPGNLPVLNGDQICYAIGVNSGCSGCELGSLGLCRYVSVVDPFARIVVGREQRVFNCIHKDLAAAFDLAENKEDGDFLTSVGIRDFRIESHLCPADPKEAPIIRAQLGSYDTGDVPPGPPGPPIGIVGWEHTSLIHNTFHEMTWADVPQRPWAVDRTSAWGDGGAMRLWGIIQPIITNPTLMNRHGSVREVDCAALNDREQLSATVPATLGNPAIPADTLLNNLLIGIVHNPRSRWCANLIYGAYLSTRCPEYGRAVSGIAESLYIHFAANCDPYRQNYVAPLFLRFVTGAYSPFATFPYLAVPDETSWALHEIPVMPNERWEDWLEIDEVDVEWDWDDIAHRFGPSQPGFVN